MKWTSKDIENYNSAKEYIDTVVIPLSPLTFGSEMKQSATNVEFISLLSNSLERQFTGRLVLSPAFTYLKNEQMDDNVNRLQAWEETIQNSDFKHIFYITSEHDWKNHEDKLSGKLIWLPSIPLDGLQDAQKFSIIESQVKQILSIFTQKWHENL